MNIEFLMKMGLSEEEARARIESANAEMVNRARFAPPDGFTIDDNVLTITDFGRKLLMASQHRARARLTKSPKDGDTALVRGWRFKASPPSAGPGAYWGGMYPIQVVTGSVWHAVDDIPYSFPDAPADTWDSICNRWRELMQGYHE